MTKKYIRIQVRFKVWCFHENKTYFRTIFYDFLSFTYLSTTTIGLSLPVTTIKPFQIIKADDTIIPKFNTW